MSGKRMDNNDNKQELSGKETTATDQTTQAERSVKQIGSSSQEQEFKIAYKDVMSKMKTDHEMKQRMQDKLNESRGGRRQENRRPGRLKIVAASLVVAVGIGIAAPSVWNQVNQSPGQVTQVAQGVTIPKMELPGANGAQMSMVPLVVFNGNVYTQASTQMEAAAAEGLRGELLGRTSGGIHELSSDAEYTELASNIGEADIYAVNGYDSDFRIMSFTEIDGEVFAELFEHTNGITVTKGEDVLGQLGLQGNVAAAQWESFESWNNGQGAYSDLAVDGNLESFVAALNEAAPLEAEPLIEQGIYEDESRKTIYLTLQDNTRVELVLFPDNLVRYGNVPVFFEVEQGAFQAFWDSLEG